MLRRPGQLADGDGRARPLRRRPRQQRDPQPGGDEFADAGRAVGLELDPRNEALGRGGTGEDRLQPAVGGQADERLVADVRQRRVQLGGQPVARRQGGSPGAWRSGAKDQQLVLVESFV